MPACRPAITILAVLAACAPAPAGRGVIALVDDAGDTTRLEAPAQRVVSLSPATTEILFDIGAGATLVGRTTWCDYPAAALDVPSVGDGIAPNLEAVLATEPDLVLLYPAAQNDAAAARLREMGVPALQLRSDLLADVPRLARLLGRATGHEERAAAAVARYETALADASRTPAAHPVSVFLLVWAEPPLTVGRGSYLTDLLARAGGRNVFDDLPASSGPVSIESVVARDPDAILVLGADQPAFATRPEWQPVDAVRDRRFVHADGSQFARPGPRSPAAIRALAAALDSVAR